MCRAYAVFENATDGMNLHKKLKASGIKEAICPSPRHLSKCCGISLVFDKKDRSSVEASARKLDIKTEIYEEAE